MSIDFDQKQYEYRSMLAEEGATLNTGAAEWSYGNGATGIIGIPFSEGKWEVTEMFFQSNIHPAASGVTIDLMDYSAGFQNQATTIASITLANATDGNGQANNAWKAVKFDPMPTVEGPVMLGFLTRNVSPGVGNARVGAVLRRIIED